MFDLVHVQIMQVGVCEGDRGIVGSVERSLQNFGEMLIMTITIAVPRVEYFGILISCSIFSVIVALVLFCLWSFTQSGSHLDRLNELMTIKLKIHDEETIDMEKAQKYGTFSESINS